MSLAVRLVSLVLLAAALVAPALRWRRAAFAGFIAFGIGSFALRAGWPDKPLAPRACEGIVNPGLAMHSLQNTPHIVLFALCFFIARAQFGWYKTENRANQRANLGAFLLTLAVGGLVELAEGVSGSGHCRLRDLLPDAAGALLGWVALAAPMAVWRARSIAPPSRE